MKYDLQTIKASFRSIEHLKHELFITKYNYFVEAFSNDRFSIIYIIPKSFMKEIWKSPGFRSAAYLSICFGLPYIVPSPWKDSDLWSQTANSVAGAGVLGTLTWLFSKVSGENEVQSTSSDIQARLVKFSTGLGLGGVAFGIVVIIAKSFNWVAFGGQGWEQTSIESLARTMVFLALKHLAVAGAEELVFRGYGFQTLQQAIGTTLASGMLTGIFTLAHGTEPQSLLGQGALGLALISLRLTGNSWWLPFGYHFAWNYAQTAIVGPPEWSSLQTLIPQGPYPWIGRPGYPEPGMLTTLVNIAVAICGAAIKWHCKTSDRRS
jgi:membrane protease YdiL (CAAX protease family)